VIILKTSREKAEEQVFNKLRSKIPQEESEQIENKKQDENGEDIIDNNTNSEQQKDPNAKNDDQVRELAKNSVDEAELNIRAVEDVFKGFYCELPVDQFNSQNDVVDELAKLLKFKNKTNAARRPPRIIMATPPCIDKNGIADKVCNQLKIIHVNIMDLLRKEIEKKNENSLIILDSLEKNELVDDKFVLKLLEDRLFCSDCMINGWIVTGFPKSNLQINFIEKLNPEIKPSLIVLVNAEAEEIKKMAEKIKFDPKTGKYYKQVEGDKFENVNNPSSKVTSDVINRLVPRNQDKPEILEKRLKVWEEVSKILSEKDFKNFLQLNGYENDEKKLSQLIIDAVGYNS
jgi:adenylate kinase